MKKSILLSIVLVLFGLNLFAERTKQEHLQQGDILGSFYFTDANTSYAIAKNEIIFKTTDAGSTWTPVSKMESPRLSSLYFTNVSIGGANGANATIFKATDHEKTWKSWLQEFLISINLFVFLLQAKVMS